MDGFARNVLDVLTAHVCVLDGDGTLLAVNRAWRDFARANGPVRANVAEGANYLAVCDAADDPLARSFAAGLRSVLRGERDLFVQEYPCHAPGEPRWFVGRATRFAGDGPARAVVAHENVTARKLAEERLREQAGAAAQLNSELRGRNEELRAAARGRDEFLTMLAHELRNPLVPIRNGLHILKSPRADAGALARARDMMERQLRNLTQIVDDLLEVSRLTRGRIELRTEHLDLARLVREVTEDHRPAFERAGVGLSLQAPEGPAWEEGDPTRLAQVLDNLLENAAKFTGPGGAVTVRLEVHDDRRRAVLTVADTGVGIEPDMLPRVFAAFAQADRSLDRSQGGLGLGLALVKGLVELHGGEVRAASAGRGRGAEFTIALPLSSDSV